MREFYEQFLSYARAYADSVPNYQPADNYLALANIAASYAIDSVCNSIIFGSAGARSASAVSLKPSAPASSAPDPSKPRPIFAKPDAECSEIIQLGDRLASDLGDWSRQDPNVSESEWTPGQRAVEHAAAPIMTAFASKIEAVGMPSGNPVLQDFVLFAAVFMRAFTASLESYVPADNYLLVAGTRADNIVVTACQAAAG